jgi:dCMP deaminase
LNVGAVVTTWDMTQIVSWGYNGNYRGGPNTCDSDTPGQCGCLHAEDNAMVKAPYQGGPFIMFCTHTPCKQCAKRIINANIGKVICATAYRSQEGVELLRAAGIPVMIRDSE